MTIVYWNQTEETMERSELTALQLRRLRNTLLRCDRVPFYHERLAKAQVFEGRFVSLDDLRRLPFTSKSDLRDHYPFGLLAVEPGELSRIHASSGTRGKPTVAAYTPMDVHVWAEVCARSLVCAGIGKHDVIHNAYGYGLFTGGLGLHYGAEALGAAVVPISGGNTARQVMLLRDFQSTVLCCTPSYALALAEALHAGGGRAELALRVGIFGAEPWSDAVAAAIEASLGITALNIYGLSEIIGPGVSMECREGRHGLHIWEDHFYPEVVNPQTLEPLPPGTAGELVLTSLTKEAMPLLRYRTGDVCALIDEPCPCGRTHRRMTRVKGRTDDMLIIRGVNVFPSEIEAALLEAEHLAPHYQIFIVRQGSLDALRVEVEVSDECAHLIRLASDTTVALERLQSQTAARLRERLLIGVDLTLRYPHDLPRFEGKAMRVIDTRD